MALLIRLERAFEMLLFGSRWILAPFYLGLAISLVVLLVKFAVATGELVLHGLTLSEDQLIIDVLGLVDLSLMANLVIMVTFSGYENFVSRMHLDNHADRPDWMDHIGFSELKLKLLASIVAISAIHLLEDFMNTSNLANRDLGWRAGLQLLFIVSGVLLALMDRISKQPGKEHE